MLGGVGADQILAAPRHIDEALPGDVDGEHADRLRFAGAEGERAIEASIGRDEIEPSVVPLSATGGVCREVVDENAPATPIVDEPDLEPDAAAVATGSELYERLRVCAPPHVLQPQTPDGADPHLPAVAVADDDPSRPPDDEG